ncbi:alpha/beta hydrolase [Enterococcus sp. BWR-S5]|uniref:alpha/beta hydrolase n=1 Tax=Enterococcus sp. BWR-S5 TaxID=2787714 RepID=UPI001920F757|nr:alpha/beta hydrolase family protein [Enterococcus sp. BWR-S5]MBL1224259.1 esterase family protein [Enterococcus sp. BWR-S5]
MALIELSYYSQVLNLSTKVVCILPNTPLQDIPVVYLLHGLGGDSTAWSRFSTIEYDIEKMNIAIIMPQTSSGAYTDTAYSVKYWEYISQELPQTIQTFFPQLSTTPEKTFAAGQSLGGYGALKLGFGTDNFSAIASLSGALVDGEHFDEAFQFASKEFFEGVFGDLHHFKGSSNDIFHLVEKKIAENRPIPQVYLACGTEDPFYETNKRAVKLFRKGGLHVQLKSSKGSHDWHYWNEEIKHVLVWLKNQLDK